MNKKRKPCNNAPRQIKSANSLLRQWNIAVQSLASYHARFALAPLVVAFTTTVNFIMSNLKKELEIITIF